MWKRKPLLSVVIEERFSHSVDASFTATTPTSRKRNLKSQLIVQPTSAQFSNIQPLQQGGNGAVEFAVLKLPGETLPVIRKRSLSDMSESLVRECCNAVMAFEWNHPVFLEPYFLDNRFQQRVFAHRLRTMLRTSTVDVLQQRMESATKQWTFVAQGIPHAQSAETFFHKRVHRHPLLLRPFGLFVLTLLHRWQHRITHRDFATRNLLIDPMDNDFTKPATTWKYIQVHTPHHTSFLLPFRVYVIDLAAMQCAPALRLNPNDGVGFTYTDIDVRHFLLSMEKIDPWCKEIVKQYHLKELVGADAIPLEALVNIAHQRVSATYRRLTTKPAVVVWEL